MLSPETWGGAARGQPFPPPPPQCPSVGRVGPSASLLSFVFANENNRAGAGREPAGLTQQWPLGAAGWQGGLACRWPRARWEPEPGSSGF